MINGWALGGIAQATLDLIKNTPEVEHYAAGYCWFDTQTEKDFQEAGCKSLHFMDPNYMRLGHELDELGIDIIHKQTGGGDYPEWVNLAKSKGIPVVESIHCPRKSIIPLSHLAKTVVTTRYVRDMQDIEKRRLEGHVESILYPCTLKFGQPRPYPSRRKIVIGRMARYEKDKLPEAIIEVSRMLSEYRHLIEFHIMGYPFNEEVYHYIKSFEVPGYLTVSGLQENKLQAVQSIDICVDPVWETSFDMVMTEAMSQGIPVVTWEDSAAPEVVGRSGTPYPAGIVTNKTIFGLARGILSMVQNQHMYEMYSSNCIERIHSRHDPVKYGQTFQRLYQEVLNG